MTLTLALVAALALLAQWASWMVWRNLMIWEPVAASLFDTDYREADRNFDSILQGSSGLFTVDLLGRNDYQRWTECWYQYEDMNGEIHRRQLIQLVRRGFLTDASILLWYDPRCPARSTRFGPGSWALVVCGCLGGIALIFAVGTGRLAAFLG